jgi:hypothetical protein
MAAFKFSSPPRPRRVLQVGVTGHRLNRISPRMAALLPGQCAQVLHVLGKAWTEAASPFADTESPAMLRVISPLAEGSDRMVAEAGLAMRAELACPLPFHPEEYKRDFESEESKRDFDVLLARATAVFDAGGSRAAAEAAYERAGQITVEQSDVLIAIWDGEPSRGRGGTAQMVDEALALGVPVVWLHAIEPVDALLLSADEKGHRKREPLASLRGLRLGHGGTIHFTRAARVVTEKAHTARTYFDERQPRLNPAWFFRWFRDLVAEGKLLPGSTRAVNFEECARKEWSAAMHGARNEAGGGPAKDVLPAATRRYLLDQLCPHYAWADGLSGYYAGLLRSGSVIANLFAAGAVFLALIGVLADSVHLWDERVRYVVEHPHLQRWVNRTPSLLEFLLIAAILSIIHLGQRRQWHQRWLKYRQLAERLRQYSYLAPLGCTLLKPHEAPHFGADSNRGWVDSMFHSITRDVGLAPGSVTPEYVQAVGLMMEKILDGQIRYHEGNHEKMEKLNHRLHRVGLALFAVTLAACVAHVVLGGEAGWLLMLATAPPALGAALYAITSQGEFARSADRSAAMKRELTALRNVDLPQALHAGGEMFAEVRKVALSVAEVMISETNDWNIVFKYRPLSLPG